MVYMLSLSHTASHYCDCEHTMSLTLTSLPVDGARYQCCFNFMSDRCKRDATGAITGAAYTQTHTNPHGLMFLHGRAVCATHARVLASDFGISNV